MYILSLRRDRDTDFTSDSDIDPEIRTLKLELL